MAMVWWGEGKEGEEGEGERVSLPLLKLSHLTSDGDTLSHYQFKYLKMQRAGRRYVGAYITWFKVHVSNT